MDDTQTRIATIRQQFKSAARPASWLVVPRELYRFLALSVRKAHADDLMQKSAALAFTTLLALIPLLATFSYLGARWFNRQQELTLEVLGKLLPYSEDVLLAQLRDFIKEAGTIRGVGFVVLLLTALAAFTTIEKTITRIWNVPHRRPFRSRFPSFTMVVFWGGPLVIGATYWSLFSLPEHPALQRGPLALVSGLIPFIMTLLGLTMLYWLAPYTTVRFRSALAGGFTASFLLEALRQGFGLYVDQARNISIIYGSFGFALLFMISIQAAWWIVLLGCEAAYCIQNYAFMSRERRDTAPAEGSWLGLAALVFMTHRFLGGEPITRHEVLSERFRIDAEELRRALAPLLRGGVLRETGGDDEGYLLAGDPHALALERVFELYEGLQWQLLEPLPETLAGRLEELRAGLARARQRKTADMMFVDLARVDEVVEAVEPVEAGVGGRSEGRRLEGTRPPRDERSDERDAESPLLQQTD